MKYLFALLSFLSFGDTTKAQDLSTHQWKHRLILVLGQQADHPLFQQQLKTFQSATAGLKERKLLVYQVLPERYRLGKNAWIKSAQLHEQFNRNDAPFQVLLIGLDGGIKLRQSSVLSCEALFATIDGMPMRRAELRQKQQSKN